MNVTEMSNEKATPAAEKIAKLLRGSMGLVTSEMKPAIVQAGVVPTIKVPQKPGGTVYMTLYDTAGNRKGTSSAYKGKFDGHTWYVFYDNLAVPAVVHDPLCECQKKP